MSVLKVGAIQNTSGVEVYTAKAWVNFNGTGTVAIRASGNVSSVSDNGVGDYTINFTTAMPDSNYTLSGSTSFNPGVASGLGLVLHSVTAPTASAAQFTCKTRSTDANYDPVYVSAIVFR